LYEKIIATRNLFHAWHLFKLGKTKKADVICFTKNYWLEISLLRSELSHKQYAHGPYAPFYVRDPKLRKINKACVRDRVVHHAVFRKLYTLFDATFIFDSYSCRIGKGTHRAVRRLHQFFNEASTNNTKNCWVLKCDVKKFFDSIDQDILLGLISKKVQDCEARWLIEEIIKSFPRGLPLGNITSQLFANVYLNSLDQYIKHVLKASHYIRYCDDFVILHTNKHYLENLVLKINNFLQEQLALTLHPGKITLQPYRRGVDFLGYVSFPSHTVLRVRTKKRMFRKITQKILSYKSGQITKESFHQTMYSYLGMLVHCKAHKVMNELVVLLKVYKVNL